MARSTIPRSFENTVQAEAEPYRMSLEIEDTTTLMAIAGPHSMVLGEVSRASGAEVNLRGNTIHILGLEAQVRAAHRFLQDAASCAQRGHPVDSRDVERSLRELERDPVATLVDKLDESVVIATKRKPIVPKTPGQREYVAAIRQHDLTFGVGPAGTGKTYLAMAVAASCLITKRVKRIVLTRPAVEAGEKLGYLPGDLEDKVNPYLRPLYDALHDMMDFEKVEQLRHRGQIEVAPLAFMRGRTLNDAFVILDEAQNATSEQMKMFLTRLGFGSKAVVTGDVTQSDLPWGAVSGLREACSILDGIDGIAIRYFGHEDVVRHPLVQKIVGAYERHDVGSSHCTPLRHVKKDSKVEASPEEPRAKAGPSGGRD
jgi:phosphate starvation-inducible protein PhoH and related proteins